MDIELFKRVSAVTPAFNQSLAEGLAVEHLMSKDPDTGTLSAVAYVDRLIHINKELFPEGLVYEGSKICTPVQQFEEITREYDSKRKANIARSDVYMVKYQFSFKGEMLYPRYVLLPFVRDGGLFHFNGALYNISPVLTDVGFSVLKGSIFIPFRRTKLTFNRVDHSFYADGKREIIYVIWSMIHQQMREVTSRDLDNRKNIHSCLAHYFFCRWGVTETFKKWGKANVMVGWAKDFPLDAYPSQRYTRFQSAILKNRHPNGELVLLVPKDEDSDFIRMLVGGFFYVMDTFPDFFRDPAWVDDLTHWRILLGHLIFGDFRHAGKLQEDIDTHLEGFEISLDEITRDDLRGRHVYVDTIWELLYEIMTSLSVHFYQTNSDEASMYNKRLMVLRYVMEEFNNAISRFGYSFQGRKDKDWTATDINDALKKHFRLNACVGRLTSEHGEINTVSYPGDNKMFRISAMLIPQDKARKTRGYSKGLIDDASRLLHASIARVGQFNNQPKNNPDGRSRINPNVAITIDGLVKRPEEDDLIDRVQKKLLR